MGEPKEFDYERQLECMSLRIDNLMEMIMLVATKLEDHKNTHIHG